MKYHVCGFEIRGNAVQVENIQPLVAISLDTQEIEEGESVNFMIDIYDTPTDLLTMTYLWTFGDGEWSTEANPTHLFRLSGNFVVDVIATDDSGLSSAPGADLVTGNPAVINVTN